jgi:hypothetical protein
MIVPGVTHTGTAEPPNPQVGERAGAKRGEAPRQPGVASDIHTQGRMGPWAGFRAGRNGQLSPRACS